MKDTKTIQTLASVSLIGGPLSLIIGGVLLSTAGLVCGIIALVMVRSKEAESAIASENIRQTLFRQAIIGIAVSGLAVILNAATLMATLPAILDAVQTGDYSSVFGGGDPSASDSSGSADSGGAFGGSSGERSSESAQSGKSSAWG